MPVCPICGNESKRRKDGKCPVCGNPIYILRQGKKTLWVGEERITIGILEEFEKKLSTRLKTPFKFEGNERKRQLAMVKTLIAKCKNIPRLARLVIEHSFVERTPRNIESILYNFSYFYALALKSYNNECEKAAVENERAKNTPEGEEFYAL